MGNCAGGGVGGVGIGVGSGIGADVGGGVGCGKLDADAGGGVGGGIFVGVGSGVSATTEVGTEVLKGVGGSVGPGKGIGVGTKEGAGLVGRTTAQKSAQRVRCGIGWIGPRISGWKRTWIGIWPENQAQHNLNDSCAAMTMTAPFVSLFLCVPCKTPCLSGEFPLTSPILSRANLRSDALAFPRDNPSLEWVGR